MLNGFFLKCQKKGHWCLEHPTTWVKELKCPSPFLIKGRSDSFVWVTIHFRLPFPLPRHFFSFICASSSSFSPVPFRLYVLLLPFIRCLFFFLLFWWWSVVAGGGFSFCCCWCLFVFLIVFEVNESFSLTIVYCIMFSHAPSSSHLCGCWFSHAPASSFLSPCLCFFVFFLPRHGFF